MTTRASFYTVVIFALLFLAGCQSLWSDESAQRSSQDAPEAIRIKALLLEQPDLSGAAIDVTFDNGQVILSGFVETQQQRLRAETIAGGQEDVNEVVNRIEVK
ncbi:MAG: BON domain-containing protein [Wenzhouxiangellaceae bacterium]|nr:BON domain-containing protein [Wenzhouxiangellaceae bacterium]